MIRLVYIASGPFRFTELGETILQEERRNCSGKFERNVALVSECDALAWNNLDDMIQVIIQNETTRNQDQFIVTNSIVGLVAIIHHLERLDKEVMIYRRREGVLWSREHEEDIEFYAGGGLEYIGGGNDDVISKIIEMEFLCVSAPFDTSNPESDPVERLISIYKNLKKKVDGE